MPSKREQALSALFSALQGLTGPVVKRNEVEAQDVPGTGAVILRDGQAGEPIAQLMSPTRYIYSHRAECIVLFEHRDAAVRDTAVDDILVAIDAIVAADPSLGGVVDDVETEAPEAVGEEWDVGAPTIKAQIVPIILTYETPSPLS